MIPIILNGEVININKKIFISELILSKHSYDMPCAGKGICGKCKVFAKGNLSEISKSEKKFLSNDEIKRGIRLACCTEILGESVVNVNSNDSNKIQSLGVMPKFQHKEIFHNYGVAIDIGTTTLVAQLYSKEGMLSQVTMINPQTSYGADVISRIELSLKGKGDDISKCIKMAISQMLTNLALEANIKVNVIDAIVITGNTAMLYLLTNSNPVCLSCAPFEADRLFGKFISGRALELPCPEAKVYLPSCISAFVGADITTAILASDICNNNNSCILVDVGTNGEIVLWHEGRLTCCSTAAGPAFEGTGISIGMTGKEGAIDHVYIEDGNLVLSVIGDVKPIGICGSGIIDLLACLLQLGKMDECGSLEDSSVELAKNISITQKDIRAVQLAKSAICAGIETMINLQELKEKNNLILKVAGGFGSYIDIQNSAEIGLIPKALEAKTEIVGNIALSGAVMILLNSDFIEVSKKIGKTANTIDLSTSGTFMELYVENMMFN